MKWLVLFFAFAAANVHAQGMGQKSVSGALGFFSSGLGTVSDGDHTQNALLSGFYGIGGDFDYYLDNDMSVGAILRYYNAADTLTHVDHTDTLFTLGGVFRAYLIDNSHWLFYPTAGVGLIDASVKENTVSTDSSLTFGLYLGMTCMYKLNHSTLIGVENMRALGLGRGKLNGWVLSDYMAKITFML